MKDCKVLVAALRCSASAKGKCKEDCPYRLWEFCDYDRIAMDAAETIEALCERCKA